MKAVVHKDAPGVEGLFYQDMPVPEVKKGEVRVKLKTAGMNHRDLFVLHRHKPGEPPLIIGSDGAGIIDAVGEDVTSVKPGDEVMINPSLGWEKNSAAPPEGFEILGHPYHGTFAEYVTVPAENVVPKPDFLTWEEAGVMSLAALTAYRALFTKGQAASGMKVFIPGIGGGVATFLLQFAKAAGSKVYVTSRSEEKLRKALELGADAAISSNDDWSKALGGEKMDLVIESVGAATFNKSLDTLKKGGTIVTFGASAGDVVAFDLRKFFYGQYTLYGSTMGSGEEYREMIAFIAKHKIKPVIDRVYSLKDFRAAFSRLENAEQFGKIALKIS